MWVVAFLLLCAAKEALSVNNTILIYECLNGARLEANTTRVINGACINKVTFTCINDGNSFMQQIYDDVNCTQTRLDNQLTAGNTESCNRGPWVDCSDAISVDSNVVLTVFPLSPNATQSYQPTLCEGAFISKRLQNGQCANGDQVWCWGSQWRRDRWLNSADCNGEGQVSYDYGTTGMCGQSWSEMVTCNSNVLVQQGEFFGLTYANSDCSGDLISTQIIPSKGCNQAQYPNPSYEVSCQANTANVTSYPYNAQNNFGDANSDCTDQPIQVVQYRRHVCVDGTIYDCGGSISTPGFYLFWVLVASPLVVALV